MKLLKWQAGLTLVVSVAFLCVWNKQAFWSGLVAGVVCMFANYVFIVRVLRFRGARQAKAFVAAMLTGETAKLIILGVLSVLAVKYLGVAIAPYIISLMINLMVFWLAPLIWINVEY